MSVELPNCKEDTVIYVCNAYGDFEKIGYIKSKEFHYDLSMTASLIQSFLHIAPKVDDEEYSMNVVHNMRLWMHQKQRTCHFLICGQPLYGLIWWFMLLMSSTISVIIIIANAEIILLPFYVLECLAVFGLAIFGAVVGLQEEEDPPHHRNAVIPLKAGKMRDGDYTCFNGHTCMLVGAAYNWYDDISGNMIEPEAPTYYCYKCDFCHQK